MGILFTDLVPKIHRSLPPKYLWLVSLNLRRCLWHSFPSPRSRIMDQPFLKKSLGFPGWEIDRGPGLGMHRYTVAIGDRQLAPVMAGLCSRMGHDILCMAFMRFYAVYVMTCLHLNQELLNFYSPTFTWAVSFLLLFMYNILTADSTNYVIYYHINLCILVIYCCVITPLKTWGLRTTMIHYFSWFYNLGRAWLAMSLPHHGPLSCS